MGGSITGAGNTTVTAEFNFWYDPEAVYVVMDRIPKTVRFQARFLPVIKVNPILSSKQQSFQ